jgi:hypothetical protein
MQQTGPAAGALLARFRVHGPVVGFEEERLQNDDENILTKIYRTTNIQGKKTIENDKTKKRKNENNEKTKKRKND